MHTEMEQAIHTYIQEYAEQNALDHLWQTPVVKFGDARSPWMPRLREIVTADHFMPEDYLPGARNVLSYYLPFRKNLAQSNVDQRLASRQWAMAYVATNEMAEHINSHLVRVIEAKGYRAAAPHNAGMVSETAIFSRWSQRHIAWIAGHGTFGVNNMLISDKGCCGRYFSVVTDLPVDPDPIVREERCLLKRGRTCGVCARRCVAGALTTQSFDREKCLGMCQENEEHYPGADVCGKCASGLPCSF